MAFLWAYINIPETRANLLKPQIVSFILSLRRWKCQDLWGLGRVDSSRKNCALEKAFKAWKRVKVHLCVWSEGSRGEERRERYQQGESLAEKTRGWFGVGNSVKAGLWVWELPRGCGHSSEGRRPLEGCAGSEETTLKPLRLLWFEAVAVERLLQTRPPQNACDRQCCSFTNLPPPHYLMSITSQHLFRVIITNI